MTAARFPWKRWGVTYLRTMRVWHGECPTCGAQMMGHTRSDFRGFATAHVQLRHDPGFAA